MEFLRAFFNAQMLVVGLVSASAALAAQGGRWSPQLDLLSHFAPFWLVGGLAAGLYGLTLGEPGSRRGLVALGVAGVVLATLLIAPEYLRPATPKAAADAPDQIKLIQFNAWRGSRDIGPALDWLAAQDADIIVLEEGERLREPLAHRTGYHLTQGSESLAILSKARPIAEGVRLPPGRWAQPPLARATFAGPQGAFTVIGTHYVWPVYGGFQLAQGRIVGELLGQFPTERVILTGDFNSTPWSFARRGEDRRFGLERRTRGLFTWPATAPIPLLPIDQVYAGSGWRMVSIARGPRLGSDHYPVVVILAPSAARARIAP